MQWRMPRNSFRSYLPAFGSPRRSPKVDILGPARNPAPVAAPILVVDDDPGILSTIKDILEFEGYAVECAANGAEGLKIIERVRPRLVLLDMRMPVLDGWQFAATLKKRGIKLPILVMTATSDAKGWAEEIEASGYVAKPFDLLELLEAVEHLLSPG